MHIIARVWELNNGVHVVMDEPPLGARSFTHRVDIYSDPTSFAWIVYKSVFPSDKVIAEGNAKTPEELNTQLRPYFTRFAAPTLKKMQDERTAGLTAEMVGDGIGYPMTCGHLSQAWKYSDTGEKIGPICIFCSCTDQKGEK